MNTSNYATSEDYQSTGIEARDGFSTRHVSDPSRISDTDIIKVGDMDVTAAMARDLGIGPFAPNFDSHLGAGDARQREPEAQATPEESTGHQEYDASVAELNSQVEAGQLGHQEAGEYSTALGQVAIAGLTISEASETIDGLADGTINPMDLDQNTRDIVGNLEATVTNAATVSAKVELGEQGVNRLADIAKGDAEFAGMLRQYASMRALGKAGHTWPEFLVEAEAWSQGAR